jgi:hypothetical protein
MAILGYGQKILSSSAWPAVLLGTTTPIGNVKPDFIGQQYTDGTSMWFAIGPTSASWTSGANSVSFNSIDNPPTNPTNGMFWIPQA